MRDTDTKWLEEKDILDRYVLGRLEPEEKVRLDALLKTEEALRQELEMTTMIVGAIRQKGREELRIRLKSRIAAAGSGDQGLFFSRGGGSLSRFWTSALILKAAAIVMAVAGVSYMVYRLFFFVPETEPVVKETSPIRTIEKDKPLPPPREEKMMTYREDTIKTPIARKSTGKSGTTTRPLTLATPTESIKTKHAQKFKAEAFLLPKTNELRLVVIAEDRSETESRLFFKNPVDLSAVDIRETVEDKDGILQWFYVHYDNQMLSVYLDNSKYLSYFKAPRLELASSELVLRTNGYTYHIDLTSKEKFRKAVLRP